MEYVKIKNALDGSISWFTLLDSPLGLMRVNIMGGRCPIGDDKILKKVEAEDFAALDWTGTYLDDPEQDAGWLSRDGRWYGCGYENHISCANLVLKKSEYELERNGWVKVNGKPGDKGFAAISDYYFEGAGRGLRMTAEQTNWLLSKGYTVEQ